MDQQQTKHASNQPYMAQWDSLIPSLCPSLHDLHRTCTMGDIMIVIQPTKDEYIDHHPNHDGPSIVYNQQQNTFFHE